MIYLSRFTIPEPSKEGHLLPVLLDPDGITSCPAQAVHKDGGWHMDRARTGLLGEFTGLSSLVPVELSKEILLVFWIDPELMVGLGTALLFIHTQLVCCAFMPSYCSTRLRSQYIEDGVIILYVH